MLPQSVQSWEQATAGWRGAQQANAAAADGGAAAAQAGVCTWQQLPRPVTSRAAAASSGC